MAVGVAHVRLSNGELADIQYDPTLGLVDGDYDSAESAQVTAQVAQISKAKGISDKFTFINSNEFWLTAKVKPDVWRYLSPLDRELYKQYQSAGACKFSGYEVNHAGVRKCSDPYDAKAFRDIGGQIGREIFLSQLKSGKALDSLNEEVLVEAIKALPHGVKMLYQVAKNDGGKTSDETFYVCDLWRGAKEAFNHYIKIEKEKRQSELEEAGKKAAANAVNNCPSPPPSVDHLNLDKVPSFDALLKGVNVGVESVDPQFADTAKLAGFKKFLEGKNSVAYKALGPKVFDLLKENANRPVNSTTKGLSEVDSDTQKAQSICYVLNEVFKMWCQYEGKAFGGGGGKGHVMRRSGGFVIK